VRKPEVKKQLGRLKCKWKNNIKMDFKRWDKRHGLG
jgi:hypothetical protein